MSQRVHIFCSPALNRIQNFYIFLKNGDLKVFCYIKEESSFVALQKEVKFTQIIQICVSLHTRTHAYSSQHTWKLHPLPPLLLLIPFSPPLPLRLELTVSAAEPLPSPLLRRECFCFPLFWSADLILARMLHVARCNAATSKCVVQRAFDEFGPVLRMQLRVFLVESEQLC